MVDLDHIAVAAFVTHEAHVAGAHGVYRSADGSCVVDALVRADEVQDGMQPMQIEGRADAREFDRRAQKRPAQAAPLGRIVIRSSRRVHVARRTVHAAVVPEHGGEHGAVFDEPTVLEQLLVGYGE